MQKKIFPTRVIVIVLCFLLAGITSGCDFGGGFSRLEQRDCVVMLGDSIFDLSGEITNVLEDLSGHKYRTYYQNGAQLEGGMINDIEDQLDQAIRAGAIRTIIMDGGGNDYLMGGCGGNSNALQQEIEAAWSRILDKAGRGGVENMVVLGYYLTASTPDNEVADYDALAAKLVSGAANRGIKLVYVDPNKDTWFSSRRPAQYTIADGIHPTAAASKELARLIWSAMQQKDIEQGEDCQNFR